ncbi:hypothetical protein [Trujillonella humicola]|uniref:hypothetical protein n=1 Tax=Trujillonella humicola TaxID=3383699 RepID=UPI0039067C2C
MRRDLRASTAGAGVVAAALLAVHLAVYGSLAGLLLYYAVELAAVALAWRGSGRQPERARPAVRLLALGLTLFFLGDVCWQVQAELGVGADVAASDACYLASYVALGLGLWRLAGGRERSRDGIVAGWIDTLVVFVAGLALVWQLSLASIVSDAELPLGTRLVWSLYPALDAALLGLVMRLLGRV